MIHLIPLKNEIEKSMRLAQAYHAAFEYNDFFNPMLLDQPEELEKTIQFYLDLNRDRSQDTLHGVFLDMTIHSDDPKIAKVSDSRVRQCMDIAQRLGVKAVIFHTGLIPNFMNEFYVQNWVDRNSVYWKQILSDYPRLSVYLENMFDIHSEPIRKLAEQLAEEPRFGICFDYAHANVFGDDLDGWCASLKPYIRHMHINDNNLREDCHWAIGKGKIDWARFSSFASTLPKSVSVLIEVSNLDVFEQSIGYLKEHHEYPFADGGCHAE